jgi:hypothetical protein
MTDPIDYSSFALVNQDEAQLIASQSAELSTDTRLLLAALGRMNDAGHAVFQAGELCEILGKINRDSGEKKPLSTQSVYAAKRKLFEAGLLEENTGGETCVWVTSRLAFRKKSGRRCPVHSNGARLPFYARDQVRNPLVKESFIPQARVGRASSEG